jgi:hypothetical protein
MGAEVMDMNMAYRVLAADTKPTKPAHDLLYEVDTGVWYAWSGTAWTAYVSPGGDHTLVVTGDVSNSTLLFADVTGAAFPVETEKIYEFEFEFIFRSAAATTGIGVAANGPASPTAFVAYRILPTTLTGAVLGSARAYDSSAASAGVQAQDTDNIGILKGILHNGSTAGTLQLRFVSEIDTSAVTITLVIVRWRQVG